MPCLNVTLPLAFPFGSFNPCEFISIHISCSISNNETILKFFYSLQIYFLLNGEVVPMMKYSKTGETKVLKRQFQKEKWIIYSHQFKILF